MLSLTNAASIFLPYFQTLLSWPPITFGILLILMCKFHGPLSSFFQRMGKLQFYGAAVEASEPQKMDPQKSALPIAPVADSSTKTEPNYPELYLFERAYNFIYGTQIDLLSFVANSAEGKINFENARNFYQEFLKRSGNQNVSIDQYIGFLVSNKFLERLDAGKSLRMTELGKKFLAYVLLGYPFAFRFKPF